jgi:hypothetical protein
MPNNMKESAFETPVLFLIFNRPDTTKRVFNEIRRAKPAELYIAADGPRKTKPGELELCNKTRAIVKEIDWNCEVRTLFRDENLGCKEAVSSAINWFFKNVDYGVILEDDCVPDQSCFGFCHELLNSYKDDKRVMMVSGTNYLFNRIKIAESYYFSRFYSIWGWATWKRAWEFYELDMSSWPKYKNSGQLSIFYPDKTVKNFYETIFQSTYEDKIDTWDYQWIYSCISANGFAIAPKYNLISNIGLTGVHSNKKNKFNEMPTKSIDLNKVIHQQRVDSNNFLDNMTFYSLFPQKMKSRLINAISSRLCIR